MTSLIDINRYKDSEDNVDWKAYRAARIANGEICTSCGGFIIWNKGYPDTCYDCKQMVKDLGEVSHEDYIRCPRCRNQVNIAYEEDYSLYQDGEHKVTCSECDYEYEITTHISFSFTSPAIIDKDASDANTSV